MASKLVQIQGMIYEIRGYKVMLDSDLAALYDVETFNLNKAVKRNIGRFPVDFMFQLNKEEWKDLIFQKVAHSSSYQKFWYTIAHNDTTGSVVNVMVSGTTS